MYVSRGKFAKILARIIHARARYVKNDFLLSNVLCNVVLQTKKNSSEVNLKLLILQINLHKKCLASLYSIMWR